MSILGVQIFAVLFAFFMIYVSFLHFKRKEIRVTEVFFWCSLWIIFIGVTLFPQVFESLSQKLFFARVMDFLMILAFMILAYLGFENYVANRKMEKKIETLIRSNILKSLKKKNKLLEAKSSS